MHQIILGASAKKDLKKLQPQDRKRIAAKISKLSQSPFSLARSIKPYHGIKNAYRLRIGSLRILYVVEKENKIVRIIKIGRRGSIY